MYVRPCDGMSPWVALRLTTPQKEAGMRAEPPSSTPMEMSTVPDATAEPEPPEDPPAERVGSTGLRGGPNQLDSPVPDVAKSSMLSLPTMVAPASSSRSTTTASETGTYAEVREAFVMGTPATARLSFTAARSPESGPSAAPATRQNRVKALKG